MIHDRGLGNVYLGGSIMIIATITRVQIPGLVQHSHLKDVIQFQFFGSSYVLIRD